MTRMRKTCWKRWSRANETVPRVPVSESRIHFFSHFANLFCFVARCGSACSLGLLDLVFSAFFWACLACCSCCCAFLASSYSFYCAALASSAAFLFSASCCWRWSSHARSSSFRRFWILCNCSSLMGARLVGFCGLYRWKCVNSWLGLAIWTSLSKYSCLYSYADRLPPSYKS